MKGDDVSGQEDQQHPERASEANEGRGIPGDAAPNLSGRELSSRPGGTVGPSTNGDGPNDADPVEPSVDPSSRSGSANEVVDGELVEEIAERVSNLLVASSSYSGAVPQAPDFYEYEEADRERILRMSEATRTDESKRRDKIVDAQTKLAHSSFWVTTSLVVLFAGLSLFSFAVLQNNIAGGIFLSIPVFRFLGSFVRSFRGGGSDKE